MLGLALHTSSQVITVLGGSQMFWSVSCQHLASETLSFPSTQLFLVAMEEVAGDDTLIYLLMAEMNIIRRGKAWGMGE